MPPAGGRIEAGDYLPSISTSDIRRRPHAFDDADMANGHYQAQP
jgi:hypothetical protein